MKEQLKDFLYCMPVDDTGHVLCGTTKNAFHPNLLKDIINNRNQAIKESCKIYKTMRFTFLLSFACFLTLSVHSQWDVVHNGGDNSGHMDLYFVSPETGYVIGLIGDDSYILKTIDGGSSWDSLGLEDFRVRSLYFPSSDTGYISGFYQGQTSVMRTVDAGQNWYLVASGLSTGNSIPLPISFFDNNTGILTHSTWAAKTTDAGITWNILENYPNGGQRDNDINNGIYVGASGLLHWSDDYGITFNTDTLHLLGSHNQIHVLDSKIFSTATGTNGYLYGFNTFSFGIITIGYLGENNYNVISFPERDRVLGINSFSDSIIYAISTSIYLGDDYPNFFIKSIDGGQTWFEQGTPEYGYPGTNKLFCVNDSICYAIGGLGCKIYKTSNGGGPLLDPVTHITLSARNIQEDPSFSLFPNPTTGHIQITSENEPIKRIEIFDLQGKKLFEAFPNDFNHQLSMESFPAGMYIVQIWAGDKILTGKVVKN